MICPGEPPHTHPGAVQIRVNQGMCIPVLGFPSFLSLRVRVVDGLHRLGASGSLVVAYCVF